MRIIYLSVLLIFTGCAEVIQEQQFRQVPNKTGYEVSWNKNLESDMNIYIVKKKDMPLPELTDYTITEVLHPDTVCSLRIADLPVFEGSHAKIDIYIIAKDKANNASEPSKDASAIIAKEKGIMGDFSGDGFDIKDLGVLEYLIKSQRYDAMYDFNADGFITSADRDSVL